jgi:hypothetical protein
MWGGLTPRHGGHARSYRLVVFFRLVQIL